MVAILHLPPTLWFEHVILTLKIKNMKLSNLKYIAFALLLGGTLTSCEDFLDRPNEDSYNDANYYANDDQVKVSTNSLYSSPWYDFLSRGFTRFLK